MQNKKSDLPPQVAKFEKRIQHTVGTGKHKIVPVIDTRLGRTKKV